MRAGLGELERIVHEHQIECEWAPRGHYHAIVESKWLGNLESTCRTLDSVDEDYEWIEGDALANVVGTRHYHAVDRIRAFQVAREFHLRLRVVSDTASTLRG